MNFFTPSKLSISKKFGMMKNKPKKTLSFLGPHSFKNSLKSIGCEKIKLIIFFSLRVFNNIITLWNIL